MGIYLSRRKRSRNGRAKLTVSNCAAQTRRPKKQTAGCIRQRMCRRNYVVRWEPSSSYFVNKRGMTAARHKRTKQLATNRHYLSKRYTAGMVWLGATRKQNETLTVQTNRSVSFSTWVLGDALVATVVVFLKVNRMNKLLKGEKILMK